MAKVAIDCDGVLADFDAGFIEVANKMYPNTFPADYVHTSWDYEGYLTIDQKNKIFKRLSQTPNWWLGLSAYTTHTGALASWLIQSVGHEVYIVTSRFPTLGMSVAKQTDWWIRACGITPINNYLGIMVVPDSNRKVELYDAVGFEYSIDDKAETVEQCDSLPKHRAYLLAQPWNRGAKARRQVGSVEAFLHEVR